MINLKAEKKVSESSFSKNFCKPLYDSYCFSSVPGTVKRLLGIEGNFASLPADAVGGNYEAHDLVILLFVDGFGWRFFEKNADKYPFLKRFKDEGVASRMTAQFPSTTAAHVTCISTGLEVGQSGVYEWFYYEPKLDRIIAPLLFSYAGDGFPESLKAAKVNPLDIYPNHTLYEELHQKKVSSFILQELAIAHSTYSQMMFRGAKILPYKKIDQALKNLTEISLEERPNPHYVYLYFDDIDSNGHRYGISSPNFERAIEEFWQAMEEKFWKLMNKKKGKIALLVVADHGMTSVEPKSTIYLNQQLPEIEKDFLKRNNKGNVIAPAGSCRDFFLHVQEDRILEAQEILKKFLDGKAEVYLTKDLIKKGFFGREPVSEVFLSRVGNLVILPYSGEGVWWYKKGHFEQHFYGAHGGLTRDEMEIPFLYLSF
jgi:predicted AlkP superfamily pyrophosphatase or phosphodiesterase